MSARGNTRTQFRIGQISADLPNQLIGRAEESGFFVLPVERKEFLGSRGEHEGADRRYLEAASSVVVTVAPGKENQCDASPGYRSSVFIAPNGRYWKPIAPTMAMGVFVPQGSEESDPKAGVDELVHKFQTAVPFAMPNEHDIRLESGAVSLGQGDRSVHRRIEGRGKQSDCLCSRSLEFGDVDPPVAEAGIGDGYQPAEAAPDRQISIGSKWIVVVVEYDPTGASPARGSDG